jgi:hypothetical protein
MYTFRYKKKREYDEKINPRFLIKRKVNCKKTIGLKQGLETIRIDLRT